MSRRPRAASDHSEGLLAGSDTVTITAESDLVAFGDGIESDRIGLSWGQTATIGVSPRTLALVA